MKSKLMSSQINSTFRLSLLIITLLGLLLRVASAYFFPNMIWPDEIFQTLEPAHRLSFGYGIISWEWRDGIRSWVFPGFLAGIMRLTAWMGEGANGYLWGVKITLCLLSLSVVVVAFCWAYRTSGILAAIITGILCSVWSEIIYFAPKALNEAIATYLLLPALYLGIYSKFRQTQQGLFWVGCLLGTAAGLRIHLLPTILLAVVFICGKKWRSQLFPIAAGILLALLIFGAVDAFTWKYPFQSFWLNFWINSVEQKSHAYGVSPWYGYISLLWQAWSIFTPAIIVLAAIGARRSPILLWLSLAIIVTHSAFAHKEYRFIYPAIAMLMILVGLGATELLKKYFPPELTKQKIIPTISTCLLIWIIPSVGLMFLSHQTHWYRSYGNLMTFQQLSTQTNICGVGLQEIPPVFSGGYTYLHHNVPLFILEKDSDWQQWQSHFNYVVSKSPYPPSNPNYRKKQCLRQACVYQRQGSCSPIQGYHINQVLKARNE
ncbi:mannosyltransferase [Calothrix sp. UHCC 0171]|uniref:mannosyltransferase n=1 Tax=Calothrix sp. UHCC 0171 TaxID=3110245 RepID=UPI002B21E749|nr:mannosyltransferase [Calothrix sp. UHCC 0171]MEA5570271.1 mannosyltransferase [Calothrix sp. UHCC 0171]